VLAKLKLGFYLINGMKSSRQVVIILQPVGKGGEETD
jgi:hypothetical protein